MALIYAEWPCSDRPLTSMRLQGLRQPVSEGHIKRIALNHLQSLAYVACGISDRAVKHWQLEKNNVVHHQTGMMLLTGVQTDRTYPVHHRPNVPSATYQMA